MFNFTYVDYSRKICLAIAFCFFFFHSCISADNAFKQQDALYPFWKENRVGFINRNGQIIIKPKYIEFKRLSNDIFWACEVEASNNNEKIWKKWEIIDNKGRVLFNSSKLAISPQYLESFNNGLCAMFISCFYGFIDINGSLKIPAKYYGYPMCDIAFSEGLAPSKLDSQHTIDIYQFTQQKDPQSSEMSDAIYYSSKAHMGYIDTNGVTAIPYQYSWCGLFSEGMADVQLDKIPNKYGFINKLGNIVINPKFDKVLHFKEGLAPVCMGKKWGYVNKDGKMIIDTLFKSASEFSNGVAIVQVDNSYGIINKLGHYVAKPNFIYISDFSDSLAVAFSLNNSNQYPIDTIFGYIDLTGTYKLSLNYDDAGSFYKGIAWIRKGNVCKYINKSGKSIFEYPYPGDDYWIWQFQYGDTRKITGKVPKY